MRRRFILASVVLGALSAMALAQSQPVVTLPLKPPPAKTEKAKPKTETVASAPAPKEALTPQAIIEIPPPAFTTEPLFPNGVPIDSETVPSPEFAVIDADEKPATEQKPKVQETPVAEPPPMPRPKPEAPAAVNQDEPAPLAAVPPAPAPAPKPTERTPPAPTALAQEPPATGKRPLRRGEMEPIDDYRPPAVVVNTKALDLMPGSDKAASVPAPQPKPALPEQKPEKKKTPQGEMMPIDDIPGGKSYKAPPGSAATFRCFVRDVMAFYDRTHIRCYNKAKNKLNFFAVDTSQPISESLVAKGLAAMKSGKPATVTFAPESDLNPSNCAAANCRRLIDIQN